jgi:hypothetical protein
LPELWRWFFSFFIGVSWNRGTPKWIVYKGKSN